jgi:PAS domain S-box-containing protein
MINYNFLKTLNLLYIQSSEEITKGFLLKTNGLFNNIICNNNGRDGITSFLENKNIDVVISDIDLTDINGIKILKKIRENNLEVPIIFISNNLESSFLLEAIKYKASDYLPISISKKELIDSIQKVSQIRNYDRFKKDMEENLEDLISAINNVALVSKTDIKGNITFVNKYFCDTTGYEKNEIIGKTHDLIRGEKLDSIVIKDLWEAIRLGKVWEGKIRSISKTKEIFFGYLTVIPIFCSFDNSIKEYMWIRFLSTEEEIEQSEFKKKVAKNIHSSRRINIEAREEIDKLFNELERCKNLEFIKYSLIEEKKRTSKFVSQISFYKKELEKKEKKIRVLNEKAKIKINTVVETEKRIRIKKDETLTSLNELIVKLDLKNQDIESLTNELDTQIMIIEELNASISKKEDNLGIL